MTVAREAEEAGFDAIFTAEVNNDALATAQLMGAATRQIKVGTWIASIHMRHSYACAKAAGLIADATGGRMILGLGVSHQSVNTALGVDMPSPTAALRHHATEVASWLRGEGPATHLPQEPAPVPVPIYLAALTSPTVELAGELADGVMPFMWSAARVAQSKVWPRAGAPRRRAAGRSTWRSVYRPLSATTSRRCTRRPAPTSPCSPPSRSISECFARAALPKRRQERKRVPAATR
jgi:alkanesulfonate monooxygenase SsuD/methylene tetrahydromethanopterin reductase-like flavin-dependent oxidoreductase (luciferase family)